MLRKKSEHAKAPRSGLRHMNRWFHGSSAKCTAIIAVGSVVLFLLFSIACLSDRYTLEVGDIAHQTIMATKEVEDSLTTEQNRKAAAAAVESSYHLQEGANEAVMESLDALFTELSHVQQYGQNLRNSDTSGYRGVLRSFTGEELAYAQAQVTRISLSNYQTTVLLRAEAENFNTMVYEVREAVESALSTTIREGQVQKSISNIKALCQYKVDQELMNYIVPVVLNACVKPNMVVDEEATLRAKEEARAQVMPVVYKQGQNIIREGERVTANQLAMLEELGLLSTASFDYSIFGGAALIIMAAMITMALMLKMFIPRTLTDVRSITVIMLVLIISVGLGVLCVKLIDVHLAPVALAAMLLTGLLGARVGLTAGITLSVITAGLVAASSNTYSSEMVNLLLNGVVGSTVAVQFLGRKPQRVRTVICGVVVAVSNLMVMLAVGLMTASDLHNTMSDAVWAMAGGILSGLIAVGFQPVFEAAFNLATPSKLLELANPNQPLLRRLLMEAPGTYHHAIVVANLSEAAAEKIGANPLLARTGAYFHDIGKLKRPLYFKENQRGDNPHDRTDAYVSAAIVTAHTRDGLQLAQKYHLPPEIQKIIVEHHGDTPVMYFYHKALQQADGKPVDVKDFRYGGERPTTKESAIVMLADTIEAAVRSMSDPTPQAIERFIERLVRGKIEDGQLSNSPLSLQDIDGICEAFSTVLSGVFHERIEYPTVQLPQQGDAPAPTAPAKQPAPQTAPVPAVKAEPEPQPAEPAPQTAEPDDDTMPEPYSAPMPDGDPVADKDAGKEDA